jgi:hypothetical protein
MRQLAQAVCGFQRLKAVSRPPIRFLAGAMLFAMKRPAERDREFIADLLPKSARLDKAQMVRVAGIAAADKAGLLRYKA